MKLTDMLFIILVALGIIFWSTYTKGPIPNKEKRVSETPSTSIPTPLIKEKFVTYKSETYAYALIQTTSQQLALIPNFAKREAVQSIIESNKCTHATSGGFYDTNYRPLGYFRTDNQTLMLPSKNSLLNGFFSIDQTNTTYISFQEPLETSRLILQTGPILIQDTHPLELHIRDDEHARRIAAALTKDANIILIALYNPENVFEGPLLGDLPAFVKNISDEENLSIDSAINFDGGSASAYHGNTITLSELTPVGSLLCVRSGIE